MESPKEAPKTIVTSSPVRPMLKDLTFSDIILVSDGTGYLKGTPDKGQRLVAVPEVYKKSTSLLEEVVAKFKEAGDPSKSLRIRHLDNAYRAAIYNDVDSGAAYFLRRLPDNVPMLDAVGLPAPLAGWLADAAHRKGLLLLSGGQGAGKTTTAAALIKTRLALHGGHAVSFENPVEMPLAGPHGDHGRCFQTEINSESELAYHIERAHRYSSPNIIYIGEIRGKFAASEALRVALGSSQQLVVATIHGLNVTAALDRLLTWAKELDGEVACRNLSQTLLGIVQQELFEGESNKESLTLKVPEFLLLPFSDTSTALRNLLRDGILRLEDDIRAQRNMMGLKKELPT